MNERIYYLEKELAIIIRHSCYREGVEFLTPNTYSQQLGDMNHPKGYIIYPHVHKPVVREVLSGWQQMIP